MEKRWIWPFELEEQIGSGRWGRIPRPLRQERPPRGAEAASQRVAANPTLAAAFSERWKSSRTCGTRISFTPSAERVKATSVLCDGAGR